MTHDARSFHLQDEITQIGATNDRADTVSQANLAANSLATEARTLINDREFVASLEGPNSPVPGLTVLHDAQGNPTAFEIYSNGSPIDFNKDGSSYANGLTVRRDASGNPTSFEKNDYSSQLHQDTNSWYFHNDHQGEKHKWVEVDTPTNDGSGFLSHPDVDIRKGTVTVQEPWTGEYQLGEANE
jgi:hypothetical protein